MNNVEMAAGREIDVVVAEKVMGWKVCKGDRYIGKLDQMYAVAGGMDPDNWYENILDSPDIGPGKTLIPRRVPGYSMSIEAAWGVVQKMTKDHPGMGIGGSFANRFVLSIANSEPLSYVAKFCHRGHVWEACGETAPLAICRAALEAIGV